ncbi:MAG: cell division protein FtsA [Elusimicrobiaceae bacterium]|nr:cell division protein FtsA [Elusimicrobiaceae bacterium]MBP5616210.1 cell division protein FtsA [Elusimicrobiaceae bacterium]
MAKTNLIVGLDVGSGKLTAVAAAHDENTNTLQVLAGRSIACRGVRGGMVTDIRETSSAVSALLGSLERECNQGIGQLFLGMRGAHIDSFFSHGTYNISRPDKEISQEDMALAIENAKAVPIKNDNEIISVLTQGYCVDKQRGIQNPEGMEGSLLEVDVQIVTGASTHINNLAKAIQRPGFRIEGTFYGLIPLGDAVLLQDEKENGVMLIDFGGETISVGIYVGGMLRFTCEIPYGCDILTSDLSSYLSTSRKAAKEIKEKYGVIHPAFLRNEQNISVPLLDGSDTRTIKNVEILDCIQPRMEELLEQVEHAVSLGGYKPKNMPLVGVLTGGGSVMPGLTALCQDILGLKEVRRGAVQRDLITCTDEFLAPQYATALALVIYASDSADYDALYGAPYRENRSTFGKLGKMFKGIFG